MSEDKVLRPIDAFRQETWDTLNPEDYAARMFPHGQPVPCAPKWKLKVRGYLNPWGVVTAWRQWVGGDYPDFNERWSPQIDRPRCIIRKDDGSSADIVAFKEMDISSLAGFLTRNKFYSVQELAEKERRRLLRFAARQRLNMDKFYARQSQLERKFLSWKAKKLSSWDAKHKNWIMSKGFKTAEDAIRHFEINQLDFRSAGAFGLFLKRYNDVRLKTFRRKSFKPRPYTFKYYDPLTHRALVANVLASRRKMTQMLPVIHEHHWIHLRPWHLRFKQEISSGMDESLIVHDDWGTECYLLPPVSIPEIRRYVGQPDPPPFDEDKLQHTINTLLRSRIKALVDIPLFVCEWKDLITNVTTVLETVRSISGFIESLWEGTKRAKRLSTADLYFYSFMEKKWERAHARKSGWGTIRDLITDYKEILKTLAELYSGVDLWYKFGISPTLHDVSGTLEVLNGASSIWQRLHKIWVNAGKEKRFSAWFDTGTEVDDDMLEFTDAFPPIPPGNAWTRYSSEFGQNMPKVHRVVRKAYKDRVTILASCVPTDSDGNELDWDGVIEKGILDSLGLYLSPKLAWDLIPYSFVVDWFCNISQWLDQFSARNLVLRWKVAACCLTRRETIETVVSLSGARQLRKARPSGTAVGQTVTSFTAIDSPPAVTVTKRFQRVLRDPLRVGETYELPVLSKGSWFALETGTELLCGLFRG